MAGASAAVCKLHAGHWANSKELWTITAGGIHRIKVSDRPLGRLVSPSQMSLFVVGEIVICRMKSEMDCAAESQRRLVRWSKSDMGLCMNVTASTSSIQPMKLRKSLLTRPAQPKVLAWAAGMRRGKTPTPAFKGCTSGSSDQRLASIVTDD